MVITGHSYIWRLDSNMSTSSELTNLELHGVEVHCMGVSRGTLRPERSMRRPYRCMRRYLNRMSQYHPDVIYVHLGEND